MNCRIAESTYDAVADCTFVLGTTARRRPSLPEVSLKDAAKRVAAEVSTLKTTASSGKAALLLGNERTGLTTDDLQWASAALAISTAPPLYAGDHQAL